MKKGIFLLILAIPVVILLIVVFKGEKKEENVLSTSDFATEKADNLSMETTVPTESVKIPEKIDQNMIEINQNKIYTAVLKTSVGDITLELNAKQMPKTVGNFVILSRKNFYNNTIFHRVIKGFMIQGGDPNSDGSGGPGYIFSDEPFEGEYKKGILAMANAGPNTNGSQFFIMQSDYDLPKNYVIFGRVLKGIEIVDMIAESPVEKNAFGEPSKPINPVKVTSVEIIEQ